MSKWLDRSWGQPPGSRAAEIATILNLGVAASEPANEDRKMFVGVDYASTESVCYEITMDGDKIVSVELLSDTVAE